MIIVIAFDSSKLKDEHKHLVTTLIELIYLGYTKTEIISLLHVIADSEISDYKLNRIDALLTKRFITMQAIDNYDDRFYIHDNYDTRISKLIGLINDNYSVLSPIINTLPIDSVAKNKFNINNITTMGVDTALHFGHNNHF